MALHFDRAEFESRIVAARKALAAERLDALLLFAQESLYYLTGFDTSGFVFFQCAVLTRDEGPITLLTRRPDLERRPRYARSHSRGDLNEARSILHGRDLDAVCSFLSRQRDAQINVTASHLGPLAFLKKCSRGGIV